MEAIDSEHVLPTALDTRRKFFVSEGAVRNMTGQECIVVQDKDFDVDNSIFGVLPEKMKMAMAAGQMKPYWSDSAVAAADKVYASVAPVAEERKPLLQFMASECDFKLEHADGSFMDHLTFCRDYCVAHYPEVSCTPLFIHSIMGVGTNIFPMAAEKIPMLASVLTPDEMDHVAAFPTILRIINPIQAELRVAVSDCPPVLLQLYSVLLHFSQILHRFTPLYSISLHFTPFSLHFPSIFPEFPNVSLRLSGGSEYAERYQVPQAHRQRCDFLQNSDAFSTHFHLFFVIFSSVFCPSDETLPDHI